MIIHLPFCYLPTTLWQQIDMDTCRRTLFQIREVERISLQPEFAYFVTIQDGGKQHVVFPDYEGPFSLMWYSKDGACHSTRIGRNRVLLTRSWPPSKPAPLNSVVYTSRTSYTCSLM